MSKDRKKEIKDIFLKYKKAKVNNDIEYIRRIETALSLIPARQSKILQLKYIHGLGATIIAFELNVDRSSVYRYLNDGEYKLLQLIQ